MRFKFYFFKFRNALNELKYLFTEFFLNIPLGNVCILDGIVKKRRRNRRTIHSEFNQNLRDGTRVSKVLLPRSPFLVGVRLFCKVEGFCQYFSLFARICCLNRFKYFVHIYFRPSSKYSRGRQNCRKAKSPTKSIIFQSFYRFENFRFIKIGAYRSVVFDFAVFKDDYPEFFKHFYPENQLITRDISVFFDNKI